MKTELNDRSALVKLIGPLRETDLKQLMAFAKGYEACKAEQVPKVSLSTQNKDRHNGDLVN